MLGLIWHDGPTTSYAVRTTFEQSPSDYFSGSAGAIYPLVKRLERAKLIRSRAVRRDGRSARMLEITDAGVDALKAWVGPPIEERMAAVSFDPIRTRLLFSEVLSNAKRMKLIDDAEEALAQVVAELSARWRHEANGEGNDPFARIATRGALDMARARLRWIRWVRKELSRKAAAHSS